MCITSWFNILIHCEMTTTSLVIIQSYCNNIDYIPYVVHYIPVTYSFYKWSLHLLIAFTYFACSHPLPSDNHQFVYKSVSVLFICFLDSIYKWNHIVYIFV